MRGIHDWVRQHGEPGDHVHFRNLQTRWLTDDVGYATCVQELSRDTRGESRVTFRFLKQGANWGIIHAPYSAMPPADQRAGVLP